MRTRGGARRCATVKFFFAGQQDRHSLVLDGRHQLIACGGKESVDFEVDFQPILFDRLGRAANPRGLASL